MVEVYRMALNVNILILHADAANLAVKLHLIPCRRRCDLRIPRQDTRAGN